MIFLALPKIGPNGDDSQLIIEVEKVESAERHPDGSNDTCILIMDSGARHDLNCSAEMACQQLASAVKRANAQAEKQDGRIVVPQ